MPPVPQTSAAPSRPCTNQPRTVGKCRLRVSEVALSHCISRQLPGGADAASSWTTLRGEAVRDPCSPKHTQDPCRWQQGDTRGPREVGRSGGQAPSRSTLELAVRGLPLLSRHVSDSRWASCPGLGWEGPSQTTARLCGKPDQIHGQPEPSVPIPEGPLLPELSAGQAGGHRACAVLSPRSGLHGKPHE